MTKRIYILLFLVFGFLMMSSEAMACSQKVEMSCCKTKSATSSTDKKCCKKQSSSSKDSSKKCNGACKDLSCGSSSLVLGLTNAIDIDFKMVTFGFSTKSTPNYYTKVFISNDFSAIWLPPKIS